MSPKACIANGTASEGTTAYWRHGWTSQPWHVCRQAGCCSTTVPVIGSGGVSTLEDLRKLARTGIHGAIVGRALYDGRFTLAEAMAAAE